MEKEVVMKKQYKKPQVRIETFALNEYIAGDCAAGVVINAYNDDCTKTNSAVDYYYNTFGVFGNDCLENVANLNDATSDAICYHTPQGTPVFNS